MLDPAPNSAPPHTALNTPDGTPPAVGLLGLGAFGRLIATHLRPHAPITAFDTRDVSEHAAALGVNLGTLAQVAAKDIVILAVPVQRLRDTLAAIAPHVRPGALVLDVASVKQGPAAWMLDHLPAHARIIATHPLFGPQSAAGGIAGLPIAVWPARCDEASFASIRAFLAGVLHLRVEQVEPAEHDRQMAYVQGLTHLLSRALGEMALPRSPLGTIAYERLLAMRANLAQDSEELFLAIQRENAFTADARAALHAALERLERAIREPAAGDP